MQNNIISKEKDSLVNKYHKLTKQETAAIETPNLDMLAIVRIELSKILIKNGAYQEALAKNLQAESYLKTQGNTSLLATCWRYMAIIYGYLGNLDKRIYYNLLTLKYLEQGNDQFELIKVLNNLGHCYLEDGQYDKALSLFLTNLENQNLSNDLYCVTIKNLGELYFKTNQLKEAEKYFIQTRQFSKEKNLDIYYAGSLDFLARIALKNNQYTKGRILVNESLAVAQHLNVDKKLILNNLCSKIKILIELGRQQELKATFKAYLKLNEEINKKVVSQSNKSIQFLFDIHEKEKEQVLLQDKNEQLDKNNQELKQFAHIVSHDLKQPIRTVNSFAGLLKRELGDDISDRCNEFIEIINSSCKEMIAFVNSVLRFAENKANNPLELIDCNQIAQQVLKNLNAQIKETKGTVTFDNLPSILGYRSEILQLFQNLISNGLKFRRPNENPIIEINTSQKNRNWIFKFKDNGVGIEEKDKERIFNIFERLDTDGNSDGSGIGLSTVLNIVKRNSGDISIESNPDGGSIFIIQIPNFNSLSMVS